MVMASAENVSLSAEDDTNEEFEVIIDEPYFCLVRVGQTHVAQVHSPVDLTELNYQLAGVGFIMQDVMAHTDGVLEILVRPLADIPVESPMEEMRILQDPEKERESVYA